MGGRGVGGAAVADFPFILYMREERKKIDIMRRWFSYIERSRGKKAKKRVSPQFHKPGLKVQQE